MKGITHRVAILAGLAGGLCVLVAVWMLWPSDGGMGRDLAVPRDAKIMPSAVEPTSPPRADVGASAGMFPTGPAVAPTRPVAHESPAAKAVPRPIPSPPPAPVPAAPVPAQAVEGTVDTSVARFMDNSVDVKIRMAELEQLGKSGAVSAVQTLMKLGDTYTYLNYKAIEALGNVKTAEVGKYLEGKTGDKDPRIISYAIQSLAKVEGVDAVPTIAAVVAANRQRPDGYQDTVCGACVKAFEEIGSPKAIPALAEEFEKTVGKTLQHEYGSQVVAAIKAIGDPSGAPALQNYIIRLEKEHAAMVENPMGQRYLEGKIKETKAALDALGN